MFVESEGRDQKRDGHHGSGAHQTSANCFVGEALSTGFAGRCSEQQPQKKRRSEEAEAIGFEVDAKTSVALERTLDTMMRLTGADRTPQGFNSRTESKDGEGWCGEGLCGEEEVEAEDNTEHIGGEWAWF